MSYYVNEESFKRARITHILLITNIVCFIVFNLILSEEIMFYFVQYNRWVIERNYWWQLLTCMFLHAGISHLVSNLIGLVFSGTSVEQFYTRKQFLVIYFGSGLIGSFFTLVLNPLDTASLGASGAIFGLLGASLYIVIKTDRNFLIYIGLYLVLFLYNSFQPGIGTWAHIFGLLSGFFFGYLFKHNQLRGFRVVERRRL